MASEETDSSFRSQGLDNASVRGAIARCSVEPPLKELVSLLAEFGIEVVASWSPGAGPNPHPDPGEESHASTLAHVLAEFLGDVGLEVVREFAGEVVGDCEDSASISSYKTAPRRPLKEEDRLKAMGLGTIPKRLASDDQDLVDTLSLEDDAKSVQEFDLSPRSEMESEEPERGTSAAAAATQEESSSDDSSPTQTFPLPEVAEQDLEGFDGDAGVANLNYAGYGTFGYEPPPGFIAGQGHADDSGDDEDYEYAEDYDEDGNLTKYVYDFNDPNNLGPINGPDNNLGPDHQRRLIEILRDTGGTLENLTIIDGAGRFNDAHVVEFGEWLASNEVLETLDLIDCAIGETGWRALGDALQSNEYLDELSIEGPGHGDVCIEAISSALLANQSFPPMLCLSVGAGTLSLNGWNVFSEALKATTCLDSLILCDNEFSNQGYTLLSHGIAENSTLRAVSISACCFNGRGATALSDALLVNTALVALTIEETPSTVATSIYVGDEVATGLSRALASNTTLNTLSLCANGTGREGLRALATALRTNTTLTSLSLAKNDMGCGTKTSHELAAALASTRSLFCLDLTDCELDWFAQRDLGWAWGCNEAMLEADLKVTGAVDVLEEALRARNWLLHRRENLLAFGMGLHSRLGGGRGCGEGDRKSEEEGKGESKGKDEGGGGKMTAAGEGEGGRERSTLYDVLTRDMFKVVGEAYDVECEECYPGFFTCPSCEDSYHHRRRKVVLYPHRHSTPL